MLLLLNLDKLLKKTNRAYLFELAEGLGRWVPVVSINSVENDTVWIYEKPTYIQVSHNANKYCK